MSEHNFHYKLGQVLKAVSQTLTGTFADLGSQIKVDSYTKLTLFVDIDINSSSGVTFQVLLRFKEDGDQYYPLMLDESSTAIGCEKFNYVITTDEDGKKCFDIPILGAMYAQVQVKAATAGSPAGAIVSANYSLTTE